MTENIQPKTSDSCPSCEGGRLMIYSSRSYDDFYVRYFKCDKCNAKPNNNRVIIEAHQVKKRQRITRESITLKYISTVSDPNAIEQSATPLTIKVQ